MPALPVLLRCALLALVSAAACPHAAETLTFSKDIKPDTAIAGYEAKRTLAGVKNTLTSSEGRPTHA